MMIGNRDYTISFLLFPSGMKYIFSIQINIVHTYNINTENYQQNINTYISVWYVINLYMLLCFNFEFLVLTVAQIPEFTPIHMDTECIVQTI